MTHYNSISRHILCNYRSHCNYAVSTDPYARFKDRSSADYRTVFYHHADHFGAHRVWIICKSSGGTNENIVSDYCQRRDVHRTLDPRVAPYFDSIVHMS
jgi:hypothetical protein